ncbi:MAG: hypothetical protein KDC98_06875 [Planctomycetes bacterium]|nr:hypothetical protein [Planctomycetota bacterium]
MSQRRHPLFDRLAELAGNGPIVVAHRGNSLAFAENTLPAFHSAKELGVRMQEFDVRRTRDGKLICIHDASLDRTTNSAELLGPGALVALTGFDRIRDLDAGSWHPAGCGPTGVPTLAAALEVMLPDSIPLIEHKAGLASDYVTELRRLDRIEHCILQSFDWTFVAAAQELAPELAVALLGPSPGCGSPDANSLACANEIGAGMLHWHDRSLTRDDVRRVHASGLLVCTYTTDDELGFLGAALMGIDATCTNAPARLLALGRGA